jgi:CRISPR-associated protein Csh1
MYGSQKTISKKGTVKEMIQAVYNIGQVIANKANRSPSEILKWVEDPNHNGKYNTVCFIVLSKSPSGYVYKRCELMEYQKKLITKYAYRGGAANGPNLSPSAKLTVVEKTFENKILKWFEKNVDRPSLNESDQDFLRNILSVLAENNETILNDLQSIIASVPKKESKFVSILFEEPDEFDDQGEWRYLGDFSVFNNIIVQECTKPTKEYSNKNQTCSLCGEKDKRVMGNASVYAFYTLDKEGFIVGGFDKTQAWKNFPVCIDCKQLLESGKNFVESQLRYSFAGIPFYLIPTSSMNDKEQLNRIIELLVDDPDQKIHQKISLSNEGEKRLRSITNSEEAILEAIGQKSHDESYDINDSIAFHFLFLEKSNAAERVTLHIKDVVPSRIHSIITSKEEVDKFMQNIVINNRAHPFSFGTVRTFFSKIDPNNREDDLKKYFFEIIDKVFKNRPISTPWLISYLIHRIRTDFMNNSEFVFSTTQKAIQVLLFLHYLQLLHFYKEDHMGERVFDTPLFHHFDEVLKSPAKKGLFLLGALTESLLNKQYSERSAKPFTKNLKSLKMNIKDFKGLLPKVQNKLDEYKSFDKGKRQIAEEVSYYFLTAGDNWQLSTDEMNFYFATGMNLARNVFAVVYDKDQLEEGVYDDD